MRSSILVVDHYSELEAIHKARPELKGTPVVFTTLQFVPEELAMVAQGRALFFDASITLADAEYMTAQIHESLWNWFLDKDGNDLSLIDGCSLGLVSAPALEYTFTSLLRYRVGLGKILKPEHDIFCLSNTEATSLTALRHLQTSIGFTLHVIVADGTDDERMVYDAPFWRKHELIHDFPYNSWKERFVVAYLRFFQRPKRDVLSKRVLMSPGGKLDNFINFIKKNTKENSIEFVFPIVKKDFWHLPFLFWRRHMYYYHFYSSNKYNDTRILTLLEALRRNLKERIHWIDSDILYSLMERYIFSHFARTFSHYQTVREWLSYLQPRLVFLSSDTPLQNLLGLAAKASNIPVVFCNHCLFVWGDPKTKSGRFKIVDYALAYGKKDRIDYQSAGLADTHILTAPLPYFARFLPYRNKKSTPSHYKKALILLHAYAHFSPGAKVEQVLHGFLDPMKVLDELGIEIIGIKVGPEEVLRRLALNSAYFIYKERRIPIFSGYSSFPEVASKADCIIGSIGTSIIEAGLMGIDYYLYVPPAPECVTPTFFPALYSMMRIARTPEELYQNIRNRQPYHDGHSVADLVDLSAFSSEAKLCENFSTVLAEAIQHSAMQRSL